MSEDKKTKKAANYALEMDGGKSAEGPNVWFEVQDGFASPEQALAHAATEKIEGKFRAVRVASDVFSGVLVKEPTYALKKVDAEDKKPVAKTRKARQIKKDTTMLMAKDFNANTPLAPDRAVTTEAPAEVLPGQVHPAGPLTADMLPPETADVEPEVDPSDLDASEDHGAAPACGTGE
jgi:hypothetical protein